MVKIFELFKKYRNNEEELPYLTKMRNPIGVFNHYRSEKRELFRAIENSDLKYTIIVRYFDCGDDVLIIIPTTSSAILTITLFDVRQANGPIKFVSTEVHTIFDLVKITHDNDIMREQNGRLATFEDIAHILQFT